MGLKSKYLYDFGVSQDDPRSELKALDLKPEDRVLCIASGGEVPLELLVNSDKSIKIDAVDISESQLMLSNLKLKTAVKLETESAARFLGYLPSDKENRKGWFEQIKPDLTDNECRFWQSNKKIFDSGPIHFGRYETYIARFAPLGRLMLGGKQKMLGLFECGSIDEQKTYFDQELRSGLLKNLFTLMFHHRLYKNQGIAEQGLIHLGPQNIGLKFYNNFRAFCTNTPVRENWMLQFVLFNRVLYEDALPSYLLPAGRKRLKNEGDHLRFIEESYTDILKKSDVGFYNKFALSNVSDWLSADNFTELLHLISNKTGKNARGLIRYIHSGVNIHAELNETVQIDMKRGQELLKQDRFPFYNLIPFQVK